MSTAQHVDHADAREPRVRGESGFLEVLTGPVARVLFALPFLVFGLRHLLAGSEMAGAVPQFIPGGTVWVYLTGLVMLAAGVAFLVNRFVKWTGLALAAVLATFVLTVHLPAFLETGQEALGGLLKDTALLAGTLLLVGRYGLRRGRDTHHRAHTA